MRSRGACRNADAVDRVDRERCEPRDKRGTTRDRVRGVRRAMFSAIVAFVCQILLIGWPKPSDMASAQASCANRRD